MGDFASLTYDGDSKTSGELDQLFDTYLHSANNRLNTALLKGHVLAHYRANGNTGVITFLSSFYGSQWSDALKKPVIATVHQWNGKIKKFTKRIGRPADSIKIVSLLKEEYTVPVQRKRQLSEGKSENVSKRANPASTPVCDFSDPVVPETPPLTPKCTPASDFITPKRSKTCHECHVKRHESSSLRKELGRTKNEAEKLRAKVSIKFQNEPRVLNQTIKRLKPQIQKLRQKRKAERAKARQDIREIQSKLNTEKEKARQVDSLKSKIGNLHEQIKRLKDQKAHTKTYHSGKTSDSALSKQLKAAQLENKSLKEKLSDAENRVLEFEEKLSESIETMDGRQFDVKTRKCINFCLEKNVSHQNASGIVRFIVKEMTGKTLEKLPGPSTVANIQREFGTISSIQCGTVMAESTNVTLAWDGTTYKGMHLNENHVMTASGPLTLGVSELGSGRAIDYVEDIRNVFTDVTNRYSTCMNADPIDTSKKLHDGKEAFNKKYQ